MNNKTIHGIYDDEELLLKGIKEIRAKGIQIKEVYTPFPVHGLDPVLGVPRTRLAICAFIYGMVGVGLGVLMMWYMTIIDWPMDVGGKPNFTFIDNLPAFVPVLFECGVFCAAHLMVLTFFLRSWLLPGVTAKNPDPRTTDDMFLMEIEIDNSTDINEVVSIIKETGATEVNEKG